MMKADQIFFTSHHEHRLLTELNQLRFTMSLFLFMFFFYYQVKYPKGLEHDTEQEKCLQKTQLSVNKYTSKF